MTLQVNLSKLAKLHKVSYGRLYRLVRLQGLTPQEAINKIENERLEGVPSRAVLKDPKLNVAKEYVKLYFITLKDAVRALNKVPDVFDNSPIFLGWPLSYWTNNDTELSVIMHMLGKNYSLEDILKITGIRLKLHRKIRRK